jgi:Zn-dependent protease with chaperone function
MFKGLKWRDAFKRAGIFTGIWLALVYVINTISPGSFGAQGTGGLVAIAIYAAVFFVLYALVFAFIERRKEKARAEARQKEAKPPKPAAEGVASLKGQRNPNTSRRKALRRRR